MHQSKAFHQSLLTFVSLQLKKENAEVAPFPPKKVRNCQPKVLEQRRAALELYIQKMLRLSTTKQQVLNFLGIEDRTSGVSYKKYVDIYYSFFLI